MTKLKKGIITIIVLGAIAGAAYVYKTKYMVETIPNVGVVEMPKVESSATPVVTEDKK